MKLIEMAEQYRNLGIELMLKEHERRCIGDKIKKIMKKKKAKNIKLPFKKGIELSITLVKFSKLFPKKMEVIQKIVSPSLLKKLFKKKIMENLYVTKF